VASQTGRPHPHAHHPHHDRPIRSPPDPDLVEIPQHPKTNPTKPRMKSSARHNKMISNSTVQSQKLA